jgi:peptidoglycan/LPS O-acetylase OafA/YrhL
MADNITNESNRIYSLQALRAISALTVLLHHVKGYSNIIGDKPNVVYNLIPSIFGYGATLFFGISGYLMAYLIDTNYKNFLFRRALRIYPPYIIAVIIIIALKYMLLGTKPQTNDLLLSLSLLPVGRITYTLNIEWTLIYEVFYYLICTIFTFKYLKTFYPFFLILWGIAICFGYFYFKIPTEFLTSINNIPFSTINYFFIFGGFVYYIKKINFVLPQNINRILLFACGVLIFIVYYYILSLNPMIVKMRYIIMGILFSTLIYFVLSIEFKHKKLLANLGDYSYGNIPCSCFSSSDFLNPVERKAWFAC